MNHEELSTENNPSLLSGRNGHLSNLLKHADNLDENIKLIQWLASKAIAGNSVHIRDLVLEHLEPQPFVSRIDPCATCDLPHLTQRASTKGDLCWEMNHLFL
ncbi:hypothetical protein O6H91_05G112100 [Diphasiastrum complanatum]|uniref:Uncharacterized protein n=1 Tax=Diphasiastrum complanatum TaxID=34168 RepID=A0ACC2DSD9_DIPCM|nr:hypothetical protein O6H91_05G112100 [Diphasiastrum complanatum]